jgi:hypothetical protein
MASTLDPDAPVAVGGVGGSGTRVVSQMLTALGYHLGTHNSRVGDNLWFRFLLKRPDWLAGLGDRRRTEVERGLRILSKRMIGPYQPTADELAFILSAAREQGWRGLRRAVRLLWPRRVDYGAFIGWGWKEPNTYIFLDELHAFFGGLKYIHTIRHGLDMAFSQTTGQLFQWASHFGVSAPAGAEGVPRAFLPFWIRANRFALEAGRRMGPAHFHLLDFDRLCARPLEETRRLVQFLGLDPTRVPIEQAAAIPKAPSSTGRYRQQDLSVFAPEEIEAVRELGYTIE